MVAYIITGKDVHGALTYNQQKVDKEQGKVLATHIVRESPDGRFSVARTAEALTRWMPKHYRCEKPVVHISLNPDPKDRLTDEKMAEIAGQYMDRMGWGGQPYIVFKHSDIEREHLHIVTVQVGSDGRKIKDSKRNERSVAITEDLEREYGLHPAKGQKRAERWQFTQVDHTRGDLKKQITSVVKPAATMYRYQTLGEFRALLSRYNIGIEEVRGMRGAESCRGLLYTALDAAGNKTETTPLKSSLFGREVGLDALERHMERSGDKIEKSGSREHTRHRVAEALLEAPTEGDLRERLRAYHIDLCLRRSDAGVTFIDHENRTVLNGSRLGEAYSANALQERFSTAQNTGAYLHGLSGTQAERQINSAKETKKKKPQKGQKL